MTWIGHGVFLHITTNNGLAIIVVDIERLSHHHCRETPAENPKEDGAEKSKIKRIVLTPPSPPQKKKNVWKATDFIQMK